MKGLNTQAIQLAFLFSGLGVFVILFGAYGFIAPWGGDIHGYIAAVHSLYRDMWNPSDVNLDVKSGNFVFFSPYMVLVGLTGKTLGVTPYRALQIAGVFNIALYASAIAVFCRTFSAIPKSPWPPLLFLLVSLFLRAKIYSWSSETSYLTLGIIQAYPSVVGWALALFSFVVAEQVVRNRSTIPIAGLAILIGLVVLTHAITASWTIGIVGLRALYLIADAAWQLYREGKLTASALWPAFRTSLRIIAGLAFGLGLSLLWPYYSPLILLRYTGVQEHGPFGSEPFSAIPAVYVLAIAGLMLSRRRRVYAFWIAAFFATFGALETLRSAGVSFTDRYVFFMGFFAQFVVADCTAVALTELFQAPRMASARMYGLRAVSAIYLALFLLAFNYYAPVIRAPLRGGVLSLSAWRDGQSTERAFYARWEPLRAVLHPGDMVMMPASWDAGLDIPAVTGARVIAAAMMVGVPESADRTQSIERFFMAKQDSGVRVQELKRWKATSVVLIPPVLDLATEMQALLGPPAWRDETRIVFTVPPERLAIE